MTKDLLPNQTETPPDSACPICGYHFDVSTALSRKDAKPKPGDITICINCTTVLTFNADLQPVIPNAELLKYIEEHKDTQKLIEAVRSNIAHRPKNFK